jgi:hypothetical protein
MIEKFANGECTFPRMNEVSEEKKKLWKQHISEGLNRRYSTCKNRPTEFNIKAIFSEDIKYYPSKREAAR